MQEIWSVYVKMIREMAKMIHTMVYYASAKIYFAEQKHLGRIIAK